MEKTYAYFLLCFWSGWNVLVSARELQNEDISAMPNRRTSNVADPVSNFFSEIGNLFLDIDETFSKQTAAKTQLTDQMKEQMMYGRIGRPSSSYFSRIQENYRNLNRRLGSTISEAVDIIAPPELLGVNVQTKDDKTFVDVGLPFLPFKVALNTNKHPVKQVDKESSDTKDKESEKSGNKDLVVEVVGTKIDIKSKGSDSKVDVSKTAPLKLTWDEFQRKLNSIPLNQQSKIIPTDEDIKLVVNRFFKEVPRAPEILNALHVRGSNEGLVSRQGDIVNEKEPVVNEMSNSREKLLGDVLNSESSFSKYVRHLLENQAKWILDFPLLRKPVIPAPNSEVNKDENLNANLEMRNTQDTTTEGIEYVFKESIGADGTKYYKEAQELQRRSNGEPFEIKTPAGDIYYDISTTNEMDFVSQPESTSEGFTTLVQSLENEPRDSLILAFTPDGVPLKLRMGPEIENPINFLHKALRAAGVSLNIPVESFDDAEPAGKEILQLGEGSGGIMTRALYLDLSNAYELKSLMRTLRMSKNLKGRS